MSIRTVALASSLIAALSLSSTARAADYDRPGIYIGANAAYAFSLFETEFGSIGSPPFAAFEYTNSWGLNARIGYRALPWLAVEFQYEWIQRLDAEIAGFSVARYNPDVLTGNLRFYLPFSRLQPYALIGIGAVLQELTFNPTFAASYNVQNLGADTAFAVRIGPGIDLYLTEHIALNLEGTAVLNTTPFYLPTNFGPGLTTDLYYFSLNGGLLIRF